MGSTLGNIAQNAGLQFLTGIIEAKEAGQPLPKAVDKIATLAIQGKSTAVDMAKATIAEKAKENIPWFIVAGLALIVIVMLIRK
jgi:uncharacterized SAM-dependent methyltransferase